MSPTVDVPGGVHVIFRQSRMDPNRYHVEVGKGLVLGQVIRDTRSTDSRIAGTRLRRPGKGATVWRAEVPQEQWQYKGHTVQRELQGTMEYGVYRLEWRGERWDRRADAAAALVAWHFGRGSA